MKLASLLSAAVLLEAASIAFCSDEFLSENASALMTPHELIYYRLTMRNYKPCDHWCMCKDLMLPKCTEMLLSSEVVTEENAAGVDTCKKSRFKVECTVYEWALECLDDLLLGVPSNTTDIVVSNFRPIRMSCGHKIEDYIQFTWPLSEKYHPLELLTLTVDNSEIRNFYISPGAFPLNFFGSLVSIHIENSKFEFVTSNEPQLLTIFSGLPSLKTISVVKNINLEMIPINTFSDLPQLMVINLTSNSIKGIEQRAFGIRIRSAIDPKNVNYSELGAAGSLPQLTVLDLSHNSLQSLPRQDILELTNASLRYLYLEGNPWNCSCEMAWMVELNTSILAGPPGVCHYPSLLRGTALQQLSPKHFEYCNSFIPNIIILVLVTLAAICNTALLFNRIYNSQKIHHASNNEIISIGQIEFDIKDSLGPNTFKER